jgi:selenoprotein W-related protein
LPNAVGLAVRILEEMEHDIGSLEVVTGSGGIFDVHVDDQLVFTKSMLGHYPQPEDVLPLLRDSLDRA